MGSPSVEQCKSVFKPRLVLWTGSTEPIPLPQIALLNSKCGICNYLYSLQEEIFRRNKK